MDKIKLKIQFFVLMVLLVVIPARAQEQLQHPIKYYVAEDGKLYWNKKLLV